MGLHRILRRYRRLGPGAAADFLRRRMVNRMLGVVNRIGPARRQCPCCGWRGARFLNFAGHGYGYVDYVCPRCGSHPRHRGLFLFLRDIVARLRPGDAVLHLAPEPAIANALRERTDLRYVTANLAMRSAAVRADVTAMPFRADAFSLLVVSHVLEHLPRDGPALADIARVTASGGHALILVPTWPNWQERPTREFGAPDPQWDDHWRIYGSDLPERIAAAGLLCTPVRFSSFVAVEQRAAYGMGEDTIFVARKR